MSFSQDGASVYLGTSDGRLLVVDLRALDKPPKEIVVNPDGKPIAAIAIQVRRVISMSHIVLTMIRVNLKSKQP